MKKKAKITYKHGVASVDPKVAAESSRAILTAALNGSSCPEDHCCGSGRCMEMPPPKKTFTVKAKIVPGKKIEPLLDTVKRAEDAKVEWANTISEAEFQANQRKNRTGRKY